MKLNLLATAVLVLGMGLACNGNKNNQDTVPAGGENSAPVSGATAQGTGQSGSTQGTGGEGVSATGTATGVSGTGTAPGAASGSGSSATTGGAAKTGATRQKKPGAK